MVEDANFYKWIAATFGIAIAWWMLVSGFASEVLWWALAWKNRKNLKTAANADPHYDLAQKRMEYTTTLSYLEGKDK